MIISSHSIYTRPTNTEEYVDDLLYRLGDTSVPSKLKIFEHAKRLDTASWVPKSYPILDVPLPERSTFEYIAYEAERIFNIIIKMISDWFTTFSTPEADIHIERFNRIISRLRRNSLVTPKQQILLQDSFRRKNLQNVQTTLLLIIGKLDIQSSSDRLAIDSLLSKGKLLEAFEYIDLIHLLNEFNCHVPEWKDLITESSKIEINAGVSEMNANGSVDRLYKELLNLADRLTAKQWFDQLLKNDRIKSQTSDATVIIHEIRQALLQNNATLYKSKLTEFITNVTPKLSGLDKISLEEVSDSLSETRENVFSAIATQHRQDLYLSSWNNEVETVSSLLKTELSNMASKSKEEKSIEINRLLQKTLTLYTAFGEVVESEQIAALSTTKHAAYVGKAVATWRKINDLFNRITICEKSHTTCGCHYAAKKSRLMLNGSPFLKKLTD